MKDRLELICQAWLTYSGIVSKLCLDPLDQAVAYRRRLRSGYDMTAPISLANPIGFSGLLTTGFGYDVSLVNIRRVEIHFRAFPLYTIDGSLQSNCDHPDALYLNPIASRQDSYLIHYFP